MKVLHVIPSLDPAGGGPPMVATRLAAAQAGLGHEVSIFCYNEPHAQERIDKSLAGLPFYNRLKFVKADHNGRVERLLGRNARTALDRAAPAHEVLHLHGVWGTAILVAAASARRAGKPYGVAPHGMLYPWSLNQKSLKKRVGFALGYRAMLQHADFIHVLNRDEADNLPRGLTAPREVIPNGMFIEEFEPLPPPGRFHATHPVLHGRPFILFLSRLHRGKGLEVLPDAFALALKKVPDIHLVIAGPDSGMKTPAEQRVRALGIADRVHFVGPLYGRHKFEALRDALVFCLPSQHETFSMAITEAMACSLPVVVTRDCHFPEVAEVSAGLTVDNSPAAIAGALVAIFNDESSAVAMGRAGVRLIHERFLWPTIARRAVEVYERSLGRTASHSGAAA